MCRCRSACLKVFRTYDLPDNVFENPDPPALPVNFEDGVIWSMRELRESFVRKLTSRPPSICLNYYLIPIFYNYYF